ncbi:cation:proton antiporter [Sphingobium sufflavum]|uniref:cation:proton antiporter domain-containing protein n=1 Tax=Sphingobium sufflavum TaxID=1129547 RepID=UPI001F1C590D|nr:cation:proton antiporter [Sphingobium sufflavum]MCE7797628.1 cation:proton antiporter [Sphingobium sufflavum]
MDETSGIEILLSDGVILLAAALACVIPFRRLGLGAVLGYLVAGAAVGPFGFGLVGGGAGKMAIAEIGIVLLLFLVGLELHPSRLWRLKRDIFGLGVAQVVLCGLALSAVILLTGFTWGAALALGLPLALSSTAQVLPMLKSSGRINSPFGERAFSILLLQDLAIVPLITIIASLSRDPAAASGPPGWMAVLQTLGAIAGLVLAGRFVLRPLLRLVGRFGERELFVAVGLFTVLAAAALMHALHLSTALGAFIAGVMLADSPYRHEIESDVEPFRTILLGLFFVAVGMVLDIGVILAHPLFILSMALVLVAVKAGIIALVCRLFGVSWPQSLGLGMLLSQGGEFGFVLFSQASAGLLIAPEAATMFSAIVTLSMVTTPFLMIFARRLEFARTADVAALAGPDDAPPSRAIVVGYGRFGQTVAQLLQGTGCGVTLIDMKPAQIEISRKFDTKVYYGDGTRLDLLRRADADQANVIAFCMDDPSFDAATVQPILEAFPQAAVFVRAFDRRQLIALEGAEVFGVTREVFESAILMGLDVLATLGVAEEDIRDTETRYRANDKARLDRQIAEGSLMAAKGMNFGARSTSVRPVPATVDEPVGDNA